MNDEALARFAALEEKLIALAEEVEQLRSGRSYTMARAHRCPGCGGTQLIHFCHIKEAAPGQQMIDLSLQKRVSLWRGVQATGAALEAYACRSCRLVEWHATTLDDVVVDGVEIVDIDSSASAEPPSTPYR